MIRIGFDLFQDNICRHYCIFATLRIWNMKIVITMRPFKKSIKVISFIISTYHRKNEMAWNHCMNPL